MRIPKTYVLMEDIFYSSDGGNVFMSLYQQQTQSTVSIHSFVVFRLWKQEKTPNFARTYVCGEKLLLL